MLNAYIISEGILKKIQCEECTLPENPVWIDLVEPSIEEEKYVEKYLDIEIPTREEMKEIELSNRFYEESESLYMTANILARSESEEADAHEVTFIITQEKLVTIRYVEPQSFKMFAMRKQRMSAKANIGEILLSSLLSVIIARIADITEKIDIQIDTISSQIFKDKNSATKKSATEHYRRIIKELGLAADLISNTQESLISIQRLVTFLLPHLSDSARKATRKKLDFIDKDAMALREHTNYLIDKVNFLLDATLGLINIQQNDIMKLFSIAAVCFVPATIVTGFYGMNFKSMPELDWQYGQWFALFLVVASTLGLLMAFRRKGWI